jgi:nicotinamidase-related amidase
MTPLLSRNRCGLLVVDVQERLYPRVERPCEILKAMQVAIRGFKILNLPIVFTEQCPEKLGSTIEPLKILLGQCQQFTKTAFSCFGDPAIKNFLLSLKVQEWVLVGLEAHICILQTAKELLAAQKDCIVLNDAISSRSIYDFSTAIAEMRDCRVRITSTETVLFELLRNSQEKEFKQICELVR